MDVLRALADASAIYEDRHFVYASGKHGRHYINMDPIFPKPYLLSDLCRQLAKPFRNDEVEVVAAPATGGIPLAYLTALALSDGNATMAPGVVWADKTDDGFAFVRAGFVEHVRYARVLVVEDLLTTGGSVEKVCREIEKYEGEVLGVSVIINRGGVTAEQLSVPRLAAAANVSFEAMEHGLCTLCESQVPIVEDIGHGAEYKAQHPNYRGGYQKLLAA